MSSTEKELGDLHRLLAKTLTQLIKNPKTCKGSILSTARQFLKDNGIEAIPEKSEDLQVLGERLGQVIIEDEYVQ